VLAKVDTKDAWKMTTAMLPSVALTPTAHRLSKRAYCVLSNCVRDGVILLIHQQRGPK